MSAGIGALSTLKMLADSCYKPVDICSLGSSDDVIQVDELDAICIHMVLQLWSHDMQLEYTLFLGKYASIILSIISSF